MANAMPWSVRGIDPDIREQAVEAAHRSGMSVGQWLNQVLAGNLDDEDDEPVPVARSRRAGKRGSRLEELSERAERLARPATATAAHRFSAQEADDGPVLALLETAISAIERLESEQVTRPPARAARAPAEEKLAASVKALESRIEALSAREVAPQPVERRAAPRAQALAPSISPDLEARLAAILAALEQKSETETAPPARPPLYARVARLMPEQDPAFTLAMSEIEARRRQLDDPARASMPPVRNEAAIAPPLAEMRQQLDRLVSRIDELREAKAPENPDLQARLDLIAGRIEEMRQEPARDRGRIEAKLEQLSGRIEEWKARPNEDVGLIRRDLASLSVAMEALSPQRLVGMVEAAMAEISEKTLRAQRDTLPQRLLAPLEQMQDDLREILREVAASRGTERLSQDIALLARRLDQIGQDAPDFSRLDDIMREAGAIKALIGQAMRAQPLEGLTYQIQALGEQIERYQAHPVRMDEGAIVETMREIQDRIERIDPQATFNGIEARLKSIAEIEIRLGAIAGIEAKLDEIARHVTQLAQESRPIPQLETIAARLEKIDRVLDGSKEAPLAGLDHLAKKIDHLDSTIEKAAKSPKAQGQEQLIGMIEKLSSRMEAVQQSQSESSALDLLQEEIARLGQRIGQSVPAVPGLEAIERSVSDLFTQFDIARRDMRDAADIAAQKAAQEVVRTLPRDESIDTLAAEGLLLIKRDLGEFKAAHGESERRTRQTLEALNSTLGTLVARLSESEAARLASPKAMPASGMNASGMNASGMNASGMSNLADPMLQPAAARPAPAKPMAGEAKEKAPDMKMTEPKPSEPSAKPAMPAPGNAFHDLPLEPGKRPGTPEPMAGQAKEGAMKENGEAMAASHPKTYFIEAARRAMQVAAEQNQAALAEEAAQPKIPKGVRALLAGAKKEAGAKKDMGAAAQAGGSFLQRSRKPILLGFAALIIALSAARFLLPQETGVVGPPVLPPAQPALPPGERIAPAGKPAEAEPSRETTGSIQPAKPAPETHSNQAIPSLGVPTLGESKRGQRLSEASAVAQADPLTIGSLSADGQNRPIATGSAAIAELVNQANLKGQEALREAALAGNNAAIFEIGSRYADGRGVGRDPKVAARWFEQAAATGHAPSQYRLASLYREGRGIARDSGIAFQWFDRAAAQGHVLAMHNAAVLLAEGVHGTPDYAGAALWFKRAAEHGIKDSQFNVAILFARGLGVNQDLGEAYRWFAAAAQQGDQDAVKKRDDIAARLSKEQLAKETQRLKSFVTLPANPAANEPGNWENPARSATPSVKTSQAK